MKYYFISYHIQTLTGSGFGNAFIRTRSFITRKVEDVLIEEHKGSSVVIINYQKITKKEYDEQIYSKKV